MYEAIRAWGKSWDAEPRQTSRHGATRHRLRALAHAPRWRLAPVSRTPPPPPSRAATPARSQSPVAQVAAAAKEPIYMHTNTHRGQAPRRGRRLRRAEGAAVFSGETAGWGMVRRSRRGVLGEAPCIPFYKRRRVQALAEGRSANKAKLAGGRVWGGGAQRREQGAGYIEDTHAPRRIECPHAALARCAKATRAWKRVRLVAAGCVVRGDASGAVQARGRREAGPMRALCIRSRGDYQGSRRDVIGSRIGQRARGRARLRRPALRGASSLRIAASARDEAPAPLGGWRGLCWGACCGRGQGGAAWGRKWQACLVHAVE